MNRIQLFSLVYVCAIIIWTILGINNGWIYGDSIIYKIMQGIIEGAVLGIFPSSIAGILGGIFDPQEDNYS